MRKLAAFVITILFVASTIPVFAGDGACKKCDEKTPFQIIADTMKPGKVKEKNKLKPIEKITVFQNMSDGIKEGAEKAKGESLRTTK